MRKIISALFYITHHPSFTFGMRSDYSYFPSDERLNPIIQTIFKKSETPAFILDAQIIQQRFDAAKQALRKYWKKPVIAYSFKTNYAPIDIVRCLGAYAEVTSGRELKLALSKDYPGSHIIFNGPHKEQMAIRTAWSKGALIQVDNTQELFDLDALSKSMRIPVRIGIRVNLSGQGPHISHFGMSLTDLFHRDVLRIINNHRYIRMEGIHFHVGTDIESLSVFEQSARAAGQVIKQLVNEGVMIKYINCGGGVMSHGNKPFGYNVWKPYTFPDYIKALYTGLRSQYSDTDKLIVYIEPGRYLIDDAVVFVSRVLRVKTVRLKQTLYIDGSTAMLPLSQYRPQIIRPYPHAFEKRKDSIVPTIMFGATCRENDILYRGWLTKVSPGDLLLFYCVGAYNQSLGSDFIFQKPNTHTLPF